MRAAARSELARLCRFAVWLPEQVPSDLTATYTVSDFDGHGYQQYTASYNNHPIRWLFLTGNLPHQFPYPRSWRRRLRGVLELDGTRVQISSSNGFSTRELREVRDSLVRIPLD
jgi:hypothetical protein